VGLTEEGDLILGSQISPLAGATFPRTHVDVAEQLKYWSDKNNIKLTKAIACDGGGFAGLIAGKFEKKAHSSCANSVWVVQRNRKDN